MISTFAFFDLDNTLINSDSMILSIFFSLKKNPWILLYLPIIFIKTLLYFLGLIDKNNAKESFYFILKFLNENDLEEFYDTVLLKKINPLVMDSLKAHKNNGCRIIIVSASPEIYLKYFRKDINIDDIIGTQLKFVNGTHTNKINGENCHGLEKVKRINAYLQKNNLEIDFNNSFAYSDSDDDKPMLSLVNNKFKVYKTGIGELSWN